MTRQNTTTYAVHWMDCGTWLVRDYTEQHSAQEFARSVGGSVHVIVDLQQEARCSTIAAMFSAQLNPQVA